MEISLSTLCGLVMRSACLLGCIVKAMRKEQRAGSRIQTNDTGLPVIGRQNWLFAGLEGGARAAATLLSRVGSRCLYGIDL